MKLLSALRRRAGLACLLAATLWFITGQNFRQVAHLRALTELGATDAAGAAIQPPGDTRAVVLPLASMDAHWWVLHAEQLLAEGRPVRHTARDNPPAGREVHWSSALSLPLAGLAWLLHVVSGLSLHATLQVAAVLVGPVLLFLVFAALFLLVRRRFGTPTAACLVIVLGCSGPFLDTFAVGEADHHGLAATFCLLAVWLLVAAGAGRVQAPAAGASPADNLSLPRSETRARRGFAAAGIAGAAALWVSAATAIPALGAIAAGALLGGWLARRAGSNLSQPRPELWTTWGAWGAGAALVFYALEYLPSQAGLRLEVNHPLHALAWWGGAAWLTRALRRLEGRGWFSAPSDCALGALHLGALLAPPLLVILGGPRFFVLNDPFLWALHHDYIQEFRGLFGVLSEAGWFLFPVLWLVVFPAGWLLWRVRRQAPETAVALSLALVPALVAMVLTVRQVRWQGLAAALLTVLVATLFVTIRRIPALPHGHRGLRIWACVLVACGLAQHPLLVAWSRLRADPSTPPAEPAELASLVVRDVAWALQPRPGEPPPVILSGPTTSTQLAYFGGFRVLGTLYWENLEGLKTAAAIFDATDPEESLRLCVQHGVTHLVMFSWDDFGSAYARLYRRFNPEAGLETAAAAPLLSEHRIPRWLRPLAYSIPPALGLAGQSVQVYEVRPGQTGAEAYFHLGRFLRETGHADEALAALRRSQALLAADPGAASPGLLSSLAGELQSGGDDSAAVVSLRVLLARSPQDRDALRQLILLLTTSPNPAVRNGAEALTLAERLIAVPPPLSWDEVEALVRAQAAAGNLPQAQDFARQGLDSARQQGHEGEVRRFQALLDEFATTRTGARPPAP